MQFRKALLALAVSAALPATAVAQSPAVTDPVTVTAKGFEALVADTPRSVNIITAEEIAFTDARTLGDLLIGQPGIAVEASGAVALDPIIRGLKRDQVVILIDGARVNLFQPASRGSMASYINVDMIERIEIIRGPSSVLYGSGASGGVINIITKSGRFTSEPTVSGWTRLGVNSADQGYRGALGTSFSDQQNVLDISAAYLNTSDYRMGDGEKLRDSGTAQNAFHLGYSRKLDDRQQIELTAQYDERRNVFYLVSRAPFSRVTGADFDKKTGVVAEDGDAGTPVGGTTTHYAPYKSRTLFQGRYIRDLDDTWNTRMTVSAYSQQLKRGNYDWSDALQRETFRSNNIFDNYGASLSFEFTPNDRHLLKAGLDWQRLITSPNALFEDGTRGTVLFDGDDETRFRPSRTDHPSTGNFSEAFRFNLAENAKLETIGVYLYDEINLDSFIVDLGLRYDHVVGDADKASAQGPLKRTDGVISWSAGVLWQSSPEFNPYLNLSQGYRGASLLERFLLYEAATAVWLPNPQLKPEKNTSLEIGARGDVGNTRYSLAVYQSDINDFIGLQTAEAAGGISRQNINLDKVRIRGVEYTINHALGNDISIYSVGTWLRGENLDPGYNEPLTQMPPPELMLGISHQPSHGWNWRTQLRAVAKQDRIGTKLNGGEVTSPGFATLDAFLGYRFGSAMGFSSSELMLSLTNILDKDYREHVVQTLDTTGTVQEVKRPGRSIGLAWYARF